MKLKVYYLAKKLTNHYLDKMDLIDRPFKPDWEDYFMRLAILVSKRANCMKRSIGAILVSNKRIVSTGYNGTPFGF